MNWKIEVYSYTLSSGLSLVETYTNDAPGGIVSSIQVDLEGNGNCLTASFQGVPKKLSISDRYFSKIYLNDMSIPLFYGYFSTVPNKDSSKVQQYQLQGIKTLLKTSIIDVFWYSSTDDLSGITPHRDTVNALLPYLPNYVLATDNQASTTSGNKPPVVATGKDITSIFDTIISAATDAVYTWGVDGTGTLFVKQVDSTALDLTSASNAVITYDSQNSEDLVTSVRFVFGMPGSFNGLSQMKGYTTAAYNNKIVSNTWQGTYLTNNYDLRPIMHSYTDDTLAEQYGTFEKVVTLPLSPSFTKEYTLQEAVNLAQSRNVNNSAPTIATTVNPPGALTPTDTATIVSRLSDSSDSTAVYTVSGSNQYYVSFELSISYSDGTPLLLKDIFAWKLRYTKQETTLAFGIQTNERYTYGSNSTYGPDTPDWDVATGYDTALDATHTLNDIYVLLPRRAFTWFPNNPHKMIDVTSSNSYEQDNYYQLYIKAGLQYDWENLNKHGTSTTALSTNSLSIASLRLVGLDTDLLDAYAKSFIKVPSEYPSTLVTDTDYGLSEVATITNASGGQVTEAVKRITYKLSRQGGTEVTYTLGNDPQRNNALLSRISARDNTATTTAFSNSQGHS